MPAHRPFTLPRERSGLSFDERSALYILGCSLRHTYEPMLQAEWDERIRASIERLITTDREQ
jgi:hypothetical protein